MTSHRLSRFWMDRRWILFSWTKAMMGRVRWKPSPQQEQPQLFHDDPPLHHGGHLMHICTKSATRLSASLAKSNTSAASPLDTTKWQGITQGSRTSSAPSNGAPDPREKPDQSCATHPGSALIDLSRGIRPPCGPVRYCRGHRPPRPYQAVGICLLRFRKVQGRRSWRR